MLRWLFDSEESATREHCVCRGEMEVMESHLLMSVTAISRIVGTNGCADVEVEYVSATVD